jgi:hypothetical protein
MGYTILDKPQMSQVAVGTTVSGHNPTCKWNNSPSVSPSWIQNGETKLQLAGRGAEFVPHDSAVMFPLFLLIQMIFPYFVTSCHFYPGAAWLPPHLFLFTCYCILLSLSIHRSPLFWDFHSPCTFFGGSTDLLQLACLTDLPICNRYKNIQLVDIPHLPVFKCPFSGSCCAWRQRGRAFSAGFLAPRSSDYQWNDECAMVKNTWD